LPYLKPYKRLNRLIQTESFEPMISWGIRMALSGTIPIIWGLATGRVTDAVWITLTAEAVCWVELKGSFSWRLRTLIYGAMLAMIFAIVGSLTGSSIWLSVVCMLAVGFLSTLLKNIGDRASGLAICVYLLFILSNAYHADTYHEIVHRMKLVAAGALWPIFVGMTTTLVMPTQQPFRRQIALIWRSVAALAETISKGWESGIRSNIREVYLKEKDVRTAIDSSFQFYDAMAYQVNEKDKQQYELAQLRKSAGLVAVHIIAISEEMENITIKDLDEPLRIKIATLSQALQDTISRMSVFIITLSGEEKLIVTSRINRLKKLVSLSKQYPIPAHASYTKQIKRVIHLAERAIKLIESAVTRIENMGDDIPVFRSYSLIKTLYILSPKYMLKSLRVLFSFSTFTTRYALRSAIAAGVAMFIFKFFHIDHGYWLPFSVMIVIQPYFGATITKAIQRVAGTVLGGIAGSLFLQLPSGLHLKEMMLFVTFILMVYYLRRNYGIAAFVITLNLVLLFHIEGPKQLAPKFTHTPFSKLIVIRALCTLGGASLAVVSGFALLPTWDRKWLPVHLSDAVNSNYGYFLATFYAIKPMPNWTRSKRQVESKNSNVFDSFNRYMHEPGSEKSELYYDLITYNVRVTRDLNNVHLEQDEKKSIGQEGRIVNYDAKLNECLSWFNRIIQLSHVFAPTQEIDMFEPKGLTPVTIQLNDIQAIFVEKLLIELKTMHQDMEKLVNKQHIE